MKLVRILIWLVISALLTACNLLQSKEEQCLQSAGLSLQDPDSAKLVANIGDRGDSWTKLLEGFWIRYTATNSFGARVSGSMACQKVEGKWVRSQDLEAKATRAAALVIRAAALKSSPISQGVAEITLAADLDAERLVMGGYGEIPQLIKLP